MRNPELKSNSLPAGASAPVMAVAGFRMWLLAALLALVTVVVYWPATRCDFINFDDPEYVTANPHVQGGLNWADVKCAFLTPVSSNWHPLTVLSHILDCQLFGLNPRGHHLSSVLLHALNAVLVFMLLQQLTGAAWRSLFVAAWFAVHPLHVESVAWVAERKDVLSTFFGLLTLLFYARYAQRVTSVACRVTRTNSASSPVTRHSPRDYFLALLFFALGLMSKPMLVTLPFVMLLLDYWPLGRVTRLRRASARQASGEWRVAGFRIPVPQPSTLNHLLVEKLPFFALSVAASVVTFVVQKQGGALMAVENLSLGARGGNALISYCRYLGKLLWPTDLAVFYPHPGYWPAGMVLLAGGLLLGITAVLIVKRGRYPFMLMGWLWFVGTLVPVIQLVQTGSLAMADRYAYIPSLGVLILAVWGASEMTKSRRDRKVLLVAAGSVVIVLCLGLTRKQLGYWRNSETLFRHALEVTEKNYLAHNNLGIALGLKGQTDEAITQYREAIRLKPDYTDALNNLGVALARNGQTDEAISQYREAIRLKPDDAVAHYSLGNALVEQGQADEAISQYQEAIRLKPDYTDAHYNLGVAFDQNDQINEAISQFQEAIRLRPDYAGARNNLGTDLGRKGRMDEAMSQFQEVIRLTPDNASAHYNLGIALGRKGQINEAIGQFQEVIRLAPDDASAHYNLGIALGRKGQTDEAIVQFQEALRLKPDYVEAHNNLVRALEMKNAPANR